MSEMRPFCATDRQIWSKFGNQAKPVKYSEKNEVIFLTNLEQMFERTATDLDTQLTTTQQRLTCALKKRQVAA